MSFPLAAQAVDGVSITVHWEGSYDGFIGGFGEVWRHDIEGSVPTRHVMLHPGPARMAVISNDGARVAFIKQGGAIVTMPLQGGEVRELIQGHEDGTLDWPAGDWLYYTLGGYYQSDTSRLLRRVNVETGADEAVVEFSCGLWRFHLSSDAQRAIVRDRTCYGAIVAYDMTAGDGELLWDRVTDSPSCSEGLDADGEYFIDGWTDHAGIDLRRWDTLEIVDSIAHADADAWGGVDSGNQHNRNIWSTNSPRWLCMHLGWEVGWNNDTNSWGVARAGNQVLYDWIDHERIVVSANADSSDAYDSAGDFWVGALSAPDAGVDSGASIVDAGVDSGPGPIPDAGAERGPNQAPVVDAGPDQTVELGGAAILLGEAQDDGQPSLALSVLWEQLSGPGTAIIDAPDRLRTPARFDEAGAYLLRLTVSDGELEASDEVSVIAAEASITLRTPNGGETWYVGQTEVIQYSAVVVDDVTITYSTDLGQTWELVEFSVDDSSPEWGRYHWEIPDTPSSACLVHITPYNGGSVEAISAAPFEIRPRPDAGLTTDTRHVTAGCACAAAGVDARAWLLLIGFLFWALARRAR